MSNMVPPTLWMEIAPLSFTPKRVMLILILFGLLILRRPLKLPSLRFKIVIVKIRVVLRSALAGCHMQLLSYWTIRTTLLNQRALVILRAFWISTWILTNVFPLSRLQLVQQNHLLLRLPGHPQLRRQPVLQLVAFHMLVQDLVGTVAANCILVHMRFCLVL